MAGLSCFKHKPGGSLDDSLTNLQWLQEFSVLNAQVPQHMHQQLGSNRPMVRNPASMGQPLTQSSADAFSRMHMLPKIEPSTDYLDEVDYKTNAHVKPPYSYATLICMAMQASKTSKITVSSIYKWITDNFCYYRNADPTWQNSVRHNLSLNKCFIKVPREKGKSGKGGFWKINPMYAERLLSRAYRKTRMLPVQINPALQNQLQVNLPPAASSNVNLSKNMESEQLLREFEQMTEKDHNCDPHLSDGTKLGSWPAVQGDSGYKRKQSLGFRNGGKLSSSCSPLLCVDEPKENGPLKEHLEWDILLDSALNGGLSLDEGDPLSTTIKEENLTVKGTYISPSETSSGMTDHSSSIYDFDDETFLATAFMETTWPEEEEHGHGDFLCSMNLEQLFDHKDPLNVEASSQIETLF